MASATSRSRESSNGSTSLRSSRTSSAFACKNQRPPRSTNWALARKLGTMAQTFQPLTAADHTQLADQRAVVERYLGNDPQNLENYASPAGKLGLLRAIVEAQLFGPTHTYELQCMGVVFGDVFVQVCGWEWQMVEDEAGRDPCITVPGS